MFPDFPDGAIYNEQVMGGSLLERLSVVCAPEISVLHVFQMEEFLEKEVSR
jgi:hypothetical protein